MWHVYCLGDLGQWSTSGTSHNRVHTSTALRHPTRRVGDEKGGGQGNIWVLSFSLTHTYIHTFGILCFLGLLGFLQVHLDPDREEQECVFEGGARLIDSLEPQCSLCRMSNSPIMPVLSLLSLVSSKASSPTLSLLPNLPLCAGVLVQSHSSIGKNIYIFSGDMNKAGHVLVCSALKLK